MKRTAAIFLLLIMLLSACGTQLSQDTQTEPVLMETTYESLPETTAATEPKFDPYTLTSSLTTEEKVGQLFLARCPEEGALQDVQAYHLGGYILFGRDFETATPSSVSAAIAAYQSEATLPMLIAVDEEGGTVTRVSRYSQYRQSKFSSPRDLYAQGGLPLIRETEAEKCRLLTSLGINVNMAPVCDITTDKSAFMFSRSLGQSPEKTGEFVSSVVETMTANQVGSVLKHFPGYGNNTDTHTGIAVDERPLEQLEAADLIPFQAGIGAGCGAILVSHTVINCLDTQYPASLSTAVHEYLRTQMDFDGVIVTDDLVMEAITKQYGAGESAVLAVLAGNDLLCSSEYQVQYTAVLEAVQSGRIPQSLLDSAVARVLQWKYDLGLITEQTQPSEPVDDAFVRVAEYIPDAALELPYATEENFTGQQIYDFAEPWLRYGTVKKLMRVQQELRKSGLSLKIWDGFRPTAAQFKLWEICPDPTYVSDPNKGFSSHSRGNTVDITLVNTDGTEVKMPTGFDDFSALADRDYSDCDPEAAANARLLEEIMVQYGFTPYQGEWWHYSDTQSYPVEESFQPT